MDSQTAPELAALVTQTPGVCGGRPCLEGTRFPILQLAVLWQEAVSPEEIADRFSLPLPHVYAGIAYYLLHRSAIDAELQQEDADYREALARHDAERRAQQSA